MLAFIEITINIILLAVIALVSASVGFLVNKSKLGKQRTAISKLEDEMLHNHSEILQLQKELAEKENIQSKTPIFSIKDSAAESSQEQVPGTRLPKKIVAGGSKSTS